MSFIHLHTHSNFSFKDSSLQIEDIVESAKNYSMPAVALTDHNNLCGAVRFYYAAKEVGIKPIIGVEVHTLTGHLTLLAINDEGYGDLCQVVSRIHLQKNRPLQIEELNFYKNILVLSGCDNGELVGSISSHSVKTTMQKYKDIFGDRYYVELQNHRLPGDRQKISSLFSMASLLDITCVATNNAHFLQPSHYIIRDLLNSMEENTPVFEQRKKHMPNNEYYFKSRLEIESIFAGWEIALDNTLLIAERCQATLPYQLRFPVFSNPSGVTSKDYLKGHCLEGIMKIYGSKNSEKALRRLDHELNIIDIMGFNDYFLVVWDIVRFAKERGIRCSGRGSAADSLVSYLLGITNVDPLEHDLLFERFLNPERKGMPDIDLDLDSNRRYEVLNYVYEKYGSDKVAMVCEVNTINARSVVREVAKALSLDEEKNSSKLLPHCRADKVKDIIERLPELKGEFSGRPQWGAIINYAKHLAGFPRHLGTHNGGIVITNESLCRITPLQYSGKGIIICQHDKDDVEKLGLVKIDLLGLKILSVIEDTIRLLNEQEILLAIDNISKDDKATYELLRSTKTIGVFQLESPGMRELLGRIQPTNFEDIIANISLFRPGPMQADMITPYIDRRHGQEEVSYFHPSLETVLKDSYGIIVYQEQVLKIAHVLAGFTLGQADLLRRAMTKERSVEEMISLREQFVQGCLKNNVKKETANLVFDKLASFAAYGFNKAHGASFGWLAYQTAYLKAHHPKEFLCSLLNNYPCGFYNLQVLVWEAKRLSISVYPPNINHSQWNSIIHKRGILLGLKLVNQLGEYDWQKINFERDRRPFSSENNFTERLNPSEIVRENLHLAGVFPEQSHRSLSEKVRGELQSLNFSLSAHPLDFSKLSYTTSRMAEKLPHGYSVTMAGIIISRQTPPTKSGRRIIFLTLHDQTGLIDVTIFPDIQEQYAKTIYSSWIIKVKGNVRKTGKAGFTLIAQEIEGLF